MDLSDQAPPQLTHPPWLPVTLNTEPALLRPALVGSQHPKFWLAHPMSLLPSPSAPNTMFLLFTYFYFVGQPGIALAELGPAQKEAPRWGLPDPPQSRSKTMGLISERAGAFCLAGRLTPGTSALNPLIIGWGACYGLGMLTL